MRKTFALVLSLTCAFPSRAAPPGDTDLAVSTPMAPGRAPAPLKFDAPGPRPRSGARGVGVAVGLSEGKPLEVMVWGTSGAVAGSLAGPLGTIVGAGVGAVCGLVYSVFFVPRMSAESGWKDR